MTHSHRTTPYFLCQSDLFFLLNRSTHTDLFLFAKGISSALLEYFSLSNDMMSEDIDKIDKIDKDASLCTYSSWLLFFRFKVYVNDKNVAFTRGIVTFYLFIR